MYAICHAEWIVEHNPHDVTHCVLSHLSMALQVIGFRYGFVGVNDHIMSCYHNMKPT